MAKILITGAGGYIGTTLVDMALEAGHEVVALDRFFFGEHLMRDFIGKKRFSILKTDIRDVTPSDLEGLDVVMDLAALSNDPAGNLNPDLTTSINYKGRAHVAEAAKAAGVPRYILASSCSIYGFGESTDLTEESPANPLTEYATSTYDAEQHVMAMGDDTFCVSATRNATVFGLSRRMRFDLVVNQMTRDAVQKGRLTVMGGGEQWRPLVHVRDVARAFMNIAEQPATLVNKQVFNIGRDNYQIRSLAFTVRENLPFPVTIETLPDNNDRRNYNASFDKAQTVLGYEAKYDVAFAVAEIYQAIKKGDVDLGERTVTVDWYRHLLDAQKIVAQVELNGRIL